MRRRQGKKGWEGGRAKQLSAFFFNFSSFFIYPPPPAPHRTARETDPSPPTSRGERREERQAHELAPRDRARGRERPPENWGWAEAQHYCAEQIAPHHLSQEEEEMTMRNATGESGERGHTSPTRNKDGGGTKDVAEVLAKPSSVSPQKPQCAGVQKLMSLPHPFKI
jgi:hypothetical protein